MAPLPIVAFALCSRRPCDFFFFGIAVEILLYRYVFAGWTPITFTEIYGPGKVKSLFHSDLVDQQLKCQLLISPTISIFVFEFPFVSAIVPHRFPPIRHCWLVLVRFRCYGGRI